MDVDDKRLCVPCWEKHEADDDDDNPQTLGDA